MEELMELPLLSICIPTYNRAEILKDTLSSIVENKSFSNQLEIIISDNASTDDTPLICSEFTQKYNNIKYFRNDENIRDANFFKVLEHANGAYLKLWNDWACMNADSIEYMLNAIRMNLNNQRPLFFTSGFLFTKWKSSKNQIECKNLDDFVQVVSTFVTSISMFGIWKSQLHLIVDPLKYSKLLLLQVDWTYQLLKNQGCTIFNKPIFYPNSALTKMERKGYNWFQVHLVNYYEIMRPYIEMGLISNNTYKKDKRNLLYHFKQELLYIFFIPSKTWKFDTTDSWKILMRFYSHDWCFWLLLIKVAFKAFKIKCFHSSK